MEKMEELLFWNNELFKKIDKINKNEIDEKIKEQLKNLEKELKSHYDNTIQLKKDEKINKNYYFNKLEKYLSEIEFELIRINSSLKNKIENAKESPILQFELPKINDVENLELIKNEKKKIQ